MRGNTDSLRQQNHTDYVHDRQPFQQADENNTSLQASFMDWNEKKKLRKPAPVSRIITHKQRNQHKLSKSMDKSRGTRRKPRAEAVEMTENPVKSRKQELMTPDRAVSFSNTVKASKKRTRGKSAGGNNNSRLGSSYADAQTTAAS